MLRNRILKNIEANQQNIVDRIFIYSGYIRSNVSQAKLVDHSLTDAHNKELVRLFITDILESQLQLDLDRPTGKDRLLIESEMSTLRQTITNLENDIHNLNSEISILRERLKEEVSEKERYHKMFLDAYHNRSDSASTIKSEPNPKRWWKS